MKIDRAGFMRYNGGALKAAPKERISYMIGIIGAMEIEVAGITAALTDHKTETLCGVTFHTGKLNGTDVVAAKCGVGKVNAAMCTAAMILSYAPSVVINTGVAGGIGEGVKIGNMVVASHTVQYDYDTTAIGEPKGFVMIGGEGVVQLPTSAKHNAVLEKYAEKIYNGVHTGVIATGDRFVADPAFCLQLKAEFGAISCEMETGAVAQVCAVNKTPFCGLRAISDNANDEGSVDFETFAKSSAEKCIELLKDAVGELNEVQ